MPHKPPTIRGLPFIGTSLMIRRAGGPAKFHLYIHEQHRKYGPIFWENLGAHKGYFISDPKTARNLFMYEGVTPRHVIPAPWVLYNEKFKIRRGLFFMDGEEWSKHRKVLAPIFFKKGLEKELEEPYDAAIDSFLKKCSTLEGKEFKGLERLMYNHSISFMIASLIGTSYIKHLDELQPDIEALSYITNTIFETTAELTNVPIKLIATMKFESWEKFVKAVDSSLKSSRELVEKLLEFKPTDGLLKEIVDSGFDKEVVIALILDLILAAGDTTAFSTQWAIYLLGRHPEYVEKLRNEPEKYKRCIFKETLRLYPTAVFISRVVDRDFPALQYTIPKDSLVMISLYTMGHSESAYPEADKYLPERWMKDRAGSYSGVLSPEAFIPFALGVRACIGKNLATFQMQQTLIRLVQKYNINVKEDVEMVLRLVPVPKTPIKLLLTKRGDTPPPVK